MPYNLTGYNVIIGTAAGESITGTAGNDAIYGNGGADKLNGGAGKDVLFGAAGGVIFVYNPDGIWGNVNATNTGDPGYPATGTSFSAMGYGQSQDVFVGTGTNNTLVMPNGAHALFLDDALSPSADPIRLVNIQTIVAGGGGQIIDLTSSTASYGSVTILGGTGNDVLMSNGGADAINAGGGDDYVWGGSGNDTLSGASGNDRVLGGSGDDYLDGGLGNDTLTGGTGNDRYIVDSATDTVVEASGRGTDIVYSSVSHLLASNVEQLTLTGWASNGTGNSLANLITGNAGNNVLDGGTGADTLDGGAGNDTYYVDNVSDAVVETANQGIDTVYSSVNHSLAGEVERLYLTGSAVNGTGNALDNQITGTSGNNVLDGGAGVDTLTGGAGNDTYYIDNIYDTVTELAGGGTDTVRSSSNYTLGSEVENLVLLGTANTTGIGNALNNIITGSNGANYLDGAGGEDVLQGAGGSDTYVVDSAGDVVTEGASAGADTVRASISYGLGSNIENLTLVGAANINGTGNSLNNTIQGNTGDNVLNGGSGTDTLSGGVGNDTYVIDTAADILTENTGEGADLVMSSVSYTLAANFENLTLTGTANLSGTGNSLNNIIFGNDGNNTLTGNDGHDWLSGGLGNDTMYGGAGNDTYVVERVDDAVVESANQGTDIVRSSITYTLTGNVENLLLTGTDTINGTGNTLDNKINGNAANNTLNGGDGNDSVYGEHGNDTLYGGNGNDHLNGGAGNDALYGGAGNDGFFGGGANDTMYGEAGNDTFYGDGGDDRMIGGTGDDLMFGGQLGTNFSIGNDTYLWAQADVVNASGVRVGFDTIGDFAAGDRLDFSGVFSSHPPASIADLVRITDTANGTLISLHIDNTIGFVDAVILKDVHNLDLDDLVLQQGIVV